MKILICNAGSTSLKFKLYDMPAEEVLASGGVERVGSPDDAIYKYDNASRGVSLREEKQSVPDYETGIRRFLSDLTEPSAARSAPLRILTALVSKPCSAADTTVCMS